MRHAHKRPAPRNAHERRDCDLAPQRQEQAPRSPGPWWARYTIHLTILGGVFLAVFLTRITGTRQRPTGVAGYVRWAVAVAVGFGLLGTSADSIWKTTEPVHLSATEIAPHYYTVNETIDLMRHRRKQQDQVWPWNTFGHVRSLPHGSVIAITDQGPDIRLPLIGLKMERKLVQVTATDDLNALYTDLRRSGAQYLALDPSNWRDGEIAKAVNTDPARFHLTSGKDPVRVYAVGIFCSSRS
ncbi:hypothetical protein [Kitasatospora sp. NPDC088861]